MTTEASVEGFFGLTGEHTGPRMSVFKIDSDGFGRP